MRRMIARLWRGKAKDAAVVEPEAPALLGEYEERARHYEVLR